MARPFSCDVESERKKPRVGPLGRCWWNEKAGRWAFELTPEGQAEFEARLKRYRTPVNMLKTAHPGVYRWASNMLAGHHDAIGQAATIGLWKGLLRWDPAMGSKNTSVTLWIRAEVQKEVQDCHRAAMHDAYTPDQAREGESDWRDVSANTRRALGFRLTKDPADIVADRETARMTREAVRRLPQPQRQAIEMHYGLKGRPRTWQEVAEVAGVSKEGARLRALKGAEALRESLSHLED